MAKPNYSFQKRQRDLEKKKKKEEKKQRKAANKEAGGTGDTGDEHETAVGEGGEDDSSAREA